MKVLKYNLVNNMSFKQASNVNMHINKSFKRFSLELNQTSKNAYSDLIFDYGVTSLPHLEKRSKGGEDAHVVDSKIIVVADGVGGWNEVGVDPSLYSNELTKNILNEFKQNPTSPIKNVFVKACKSVKNRGSSTCCLCRIKDNNTIESLNLGDSSFIILRPSIENKKLNFELKYESQEQTHSFNFPYQVGEGGDNPEKAEVKTHEIKHNDIIILGTDGLWDNISSNNIIKLLMKYSELELSKSENPNTTDIKSPKAISEMLTKTAESLSLDSSYKSPFAERSRGLYMGGKHDDITIIVAQIKNQSSKF